jgi:glycosyltransferase involved in cell wall biosynthesis
MSLFYLIDSLDRDRFEPHVFCPVGPVTTLFERAGAIVHPGVVATFTHIWASTYRGRRWALLSREAGKLPRHLRELDQLLARQQFALVHLNDSPLIPAAAATRRRHVPIVWHLRAALPGGGDLRSRAIRAAILRLADASIAINQDVADSFDVGSVVVPNAVDLDHFHPAPTTPAKEALGLDPERPVIAYFGFIYPSKGFRDFIYAASLARNQGLDATYLIVGGPVRGDEFFATRLGRSMQAVGLAADFQREAEVLVAELGLEDCVRFVGFTPNTAQLYQASDVVVAPSRGPELGRPVIEAAACGRPVISSGSLDGAGVLLPGITGELVPQRSPEVLAAALTRLIANPALRQQLGDQARRHAEEQFDARRTTERVMELYETVIANRR